MSGSNARNSASAPAPSPVLPVQKAITHQTAYAQDLIDKFSDPEKAPHIAISVDMLDTGIDVPEIVNLVFCKLIRSRVKFTQMIGRGTRLCRDLFGPGRDKTEFLVFDLCQNVDYFNQNMPAVEHAPPPSLGQRIFQRRADLLLKLDEERAPAEAVPEVTSPGTSDSGAAQVM